MKTYAILAMALLVLSVVPMIMPMVLATDTGTGIGININTEKFKPLIWMCDHRAVNDDCTENGENDNFEETNCDSQNPLLRDPSQLNLEERKHNYAFEGESIHWTVLVMDKNKIEEISEVVGTIGATQGEGNDVEVECKRVPGIKDGSRLPPPCNARILEEQLRFFDDDTMAFYDCRLTVETPASMHGEFFITVEAKDITGLSSIMAENEFWFLNPTIALSVDGDLTFDDVRPGTDAYSSTLLVGNDAEAGSGVILDMFISGTDFYDPSSSGAACPTTNQLALNNFRYFVTNGAFASSDVPVIGAGETDVEGYTSIPHGTEISAAKRIMRYDPTPRGALWDSSVVEADWNFGNALSPGSEMALTFKLSLPEPCVGDFSEGQIFFWGEAI